MVVEVVVMVVGWKGRRRSRKTWRRSRDMQGDYWMSHATEIKTTRMKLQVSFKLILHTFQEAEMTRSTCKNVSSSVGKKASTAHIAKS